MAVHRYRCSPPPPTILPKRVLSPTALASSIASCLESPRQPPAVLLMLNAKILILPFYLFHPSRSTSSPCCSRPNIIYYLLRPPSPPPRSPQVRWRVQGQGKRRHNLVSPSPSVPSLSGVIAHPLTEQHCTMVPFTLAPFSAVGFTKLLCTHQRTTYHMMRSDWMTSLGAARR